MSDSFLENCSLLNRLLNSLSVDELSTIYSLGSCANWDNAAYMNCIHKTVSTVNWLNNLHSNSPLPPTFKPWTFHGQRVLKNYLNLMSSLPQILERIQGCLYWMVLCLIV